MTQCAVIGLVDENWEPKNYIEFSEYRKDIKKLEDENRKLKELNKQMQENYDNLNDAYSEILDENKNLKEKVETLELWLNNKEKLNEAYRKEIDKLKIDLKLYENAYWHMFE